MKLIKIETQGFKSFADKITLRFDGGVVGIVGPNGSGKSNINDAIKWVLGETSAKSLRGDSMDDVIFAGSKSKPAMDKAEVHLTFDNSDGAVSIPHQKFTISRVLVRNKSENLYYINGELARLKDIREIAMESGIGKSSLAIISQGTVSDIAEASPEQRRGIFEEAAGISKYKTRKKEALKKLDQTTEALEKLSTVIVELEKQLKPLEKQADKARIYLQKREELKEVEIGLIVEDVTFFEDKLVTLNAELESVLEAKEDLHDRISASETNLGSKSKYKYNLDEEIIQLSEKYQEISEKLRNLDVQNSKASQRRQMIMSGEIQATTEARLKAIHGELEELRNKNAQYKVWEEKSQQDIVAKKEILSGLQLNQQQSNFDLEVLKKQLMKLRTRISILQDHQKNKSNLFRGTKIVVENANNFPGYRGLVNDLIKVPEKYHAVIEEVLQNALQHIVVDNSETAVKAVNFLKQNNGGRATFIPLSSISPKGVRDEHILVAKTIPGFIDVASNLIETEAKYNLLNKFLLGNILVTETIEDANNLSHILEKRYMVVSLDGDIVRVGGVVTGGTKSKSNDFLGIDDQIKKLEEFIPAVEAELKSKSEHSHEFSAQIGELITVISELNIESAKIKEKKSAVEHQFQYLRSQYEEETKQKLEFESEIEILDSESLESEKSSIAALLKAKRDAVLNLNTDIAKMTQEKTELEKTLREILEKSSNKLNDKNQADFIVQTSKRRLAEEYELTIEAAKEIAQLTIDREEARVIVSTLRNEIKELGSVNLDSIAMYDEVNERFQRLSASKDELLSAQQTILSAIAEMDEIIISKLKATVDAVNGTIDTVFTTMFGGGHAEVRYTDPKNMLETGIEVIAQPPGKTVRNLKLFSGGEKALIAISLLFSIIKSKPLPLCILDEVEAALDDANVIRYADFLQELKKDTQFVVVTHRIGTMARVDHLVGATMQHKGVTSLFSVELSKAKELIG